MPYTHALHALKDAFHANGITWAWNEPMDRHTTFRIGGPATLAVWPRGVSQMIAVLDMWRKLGDGCPLRVLGNGSNVLISDRGFHGLMVITNKAKRVVFEEDEVDDMESFRRESIHCHIYAECGVSLYSLIRACAQPERHLSGLEFAYGIPGTVGGAVVMNAGAFAGEMEVVTISAEYYDLTTGQVEHIDCEQMQMGYRHSIFLDQPNWIILSVILRLSYGNPADIPAKMEANLNARREKQPYDFPSAGSTFKKPRDDFAGRLIERAGLKGVSVGGACVSPKHAGFIVNAGGATAADVLTLIHRIQDEVEAMIHYRLECEIHYITDGLDPHEQAELEL